MSTGGLFEDIRPFELGDRSAPLQGKIPLSRFARFAALIEPLDGDVTVNLQFSLDEKRRCRVTGTVEVRPRVLCQRCIEWVETKVVAPVDLCIVRDEYQARELGIQADVLLAQPNMSIEMLVEDDLILALPEFACTEIDCPRRPAMSYGSSGSSGGAAKSGEKKIGGDDSQVRTSPFDQLKDLLRDKSKDP